VVSWNNQPGAGISEVTRDDLYRRRMSGAGGPSRALPRVALVSCRALPLGDEDGALLQAACVAAGLDTEWLVWDDPAVDWNSYDLAVIRCTWDYAPRRDEFVVWADSVPRLANPADVIRWNTDKTYLRGLAEAGLPVVPTTWLEPGMEPDLPEEGEYVVKPAVGAGAADAARYRPEHADLARAHVRRLLGAGRHVLLQPYVAGVDDAGETGMLFFGGAFSHAFGKGAMLTEEEVGRSGELGDDLYKEERITPREATGAELDLAARALALVPGGMERLLYARVDVVPGPGGEPLLMELELSEPSFYLGLSDGAADRFAAAIAARLGEYSR
jgi:glutathione synthase/RimK-type ligase-like ATP-grasp enzyme